jgi:hypothetical protein
MKEIFLKFSERLAAVQGLCWVDMDYGQLDYYTLRPEVAFPAALVKVSYPQCEDIGDAQQLVRVSVRLRVTFRPLGETVQSYLSISKNAIKSQPRVRGNLVLINFY